VTLLRSGDPLLEPVRDPERSRQHLVDAVLTDPDQLEARAMVLGLLDEHGEALADRTTAPGHLTGSAVVVDAAGERVLVLLHTKLQRWLQPGGHADGDHELAGVALREATEETGIEGLEVVLPAIDLDVHKVDHGDALGDHLHLDLRFLVLAPADAVVVGNHESQGLRWVTIDELEDLADEAGLVRLARLGLDAAALA
jgi:8-oxo-dGTP pyrophosphatase MutT (NUDIX family)